MVVVVVVLVLVLVLVLMLMLEELLDADKLLITEGIG